MSTELYRYNGVEMTGQKLNHVRMAEMMLEIRAEYPNLQREERQAIQWVKRTAKDPRNAKLLVRYAYHQVGPMSPARQFAMSLCQQRGWRFPAASIE